MSAFAIFPDYSQPSLKRTVDWRVVRIAVLLIAVSILNAVDLVYTLFANRIGMLHELNPLADAFLQTGLIVSLISFKILMMICGLGLLWKVRECKLVIPACWLLFIVYASLGFLWYVWVSNVNHNMELQIANALPMHVETD
jgi:hypothetical protein